MTDTWSFGRKIALGFIISFLLLLLIGTVSYRSIEKLTDNVNWVTHTHLVLERISDVVEKLRDAENGERAYFLTADEAFIKSYDIAAVEVPAIVQELRLLTTDNANQQKRLDAIGPLVAARIAELKSALDLRKHTNADEIIKLVRNGDDHKHMDELANILTLMKNEELKLRVVRLEEVRSTSDSAKRLILLGTLLSLICILVAGTWITRSLTRQIGGSVGALQSSSSNLHSVANQQATATKEQATAMNEISTTISELLATSRQIAESARRVSDVAGKTASAAHSGTSTISSAHESILTIRRQVDLIVQQMLELGRKSQQIGAVLDIVSELAEQTNILAVNATIEAAGAREAGKRFAVVADEIRRLADRVAASTKEIRGLIDDVRSSVNSTIMTTEGGSKSVDAGAAQFLQVTAAFTEISELVSTTTDAAREIELSTKQQTTAVEQVTVAITGAAQASRETESSTAETLKTASEMGVFANTLLRIIQPRSA
jgi:methyl-accepting chemotaxis protein